jgi:hypothetical protein
LFVLSQTLVPNVIRLDKPERPEPAPVTITFEPVGVNVGWLGQPDAQEVPSVQMIFK